MSVRFTCPHCKKTTPIEDWNAGGFCPKCEKYVPEAKHSGLGIFHDSPNIIEITVESARTLPNPHQAYCTYRIAASVTAKTNPDVFTADFLRLQGIVELALDSHNEHILARLREEQENAEKVF